jgi:hypothetical protein
MILAPEFLVFVIVVAAAVGAANYANSALHESHAQARRNSSSTSRLRVRQNREYRNSAIATGRLMAKFCWCSLIRSILLVM